MRDQPETGDVPVVENTKPVSPGMLAIRSRASGGSGTMCALLFFVLLPGRLHVVPSSLS